VGDGWAGGSSSLDVEQVRRWELVRIRLLDASPLDAAEDFPALRVLDRVEKQTGLGTSNIRIDSYGHPEAATMLEIDGRAPATARVDDDCFRRLASQYFDVGEIDGQQRVKHSSLSLRQRPCVHAEIIPSAPGGQHPHLSLSA